MNCSVVLQGKLKCRQDVVMGTLVKGTGRHFCGRESVDRMVGCLSGVREKDVSDLVQDIVKFKGHVQY